MAKHKSFLVCRDNNAISIVEIIQWRVNEDMYKLPLTSEVI